jgi:hypothetical protein
MRDSFGKISAVHSFIVHGRRTFNCVNWRCSCRDVSTVKNKSARGWQTYFCKALTSTQGETS